LDTIVIPGLATKIRALLKYGDYLLIGTYGQGFFMYKNGVVKKMPLDKQEYLSYAHCFMTDSKGFCWISTNHGLFKVSLHALAAAYENDLKEIYYHYFGKDDGIFNTEFNGGCQPCALKLSSGLLSFPTMNGMVLFDPQKGPVAPPGGQLFVEAVLADTLALPATDSVLQNLPNDIRDLRFRLALSQFGNPENIYFSYMLEPYNREWQTQDITQNNTLHFGGLKPGAYKLRMRIRNGFEPGQARTMECTFRIPEPWYQRWWFYGLCIAGFFAFTGGLVRWRTAHMAKRKQELQDLVATQTQSIAMQTRQLESQLDQLKTQQLKVQEDNNIKARLIAIISHDLVSPLKFMSYMGKKLRDAHPASSSSHDTAGFIVNIAQELELLSLNMLNWIRFHHESVQMRPEAFHLQQLLTESVEIAATLAREKGIALVIDVPPQMEVFQFRQAIGVIIYNLAMNAVKYTTEGRVGIGARYADGRLSLFITDTGAGMPPEMVHRLNSTGGITSTDVPQATKSQFGYVIIKDLLRLAAGSMQVESIPGKGTTVKLSFDKPTVS
ncbi:MAG TPA: ATP-binding protein, partial [Chitinophagaceae bacterium]|nr:ATP-binding protein [Chitinophagaceae bacterium]